MDGDKYRTPLGENQLVSKRLEFALDFYNTHPEIQLNESKSIHFLESLKVKN